jgi:hypothetical protein
VTLVAILDADKEGFLRSAWSLIQVSGRAARNTGGQVVMYADRITDSMQVAIEETNRRRAIQEAYNLEHGITPQTIIKEIRDINDRLRAVAEAPGAYGTERELTDMSKEQISLMVGQLEAEMRSAAKQLEFERAAALRDQIQDIRLRVLEEDASTTVLKAAEKAATRSEGAISRSQREALAKPSERISAKSSGDRRARRALQSGEAQMDVTEVTVIAAGEEPLAGADGHDGEAAPDQGTAGDWLPGLRDEHEGDDAGWMARWLEKPTWDRRVTPNVIKRTGQRPTGGRRRR